jgi:hypothetical protein
VSLATWGFLELIYQITRELYTHLPNALGYHQGPPVWWPLPILGIAGVIVALAITRLRGNGGHIPAKGLAAGKPTTPTELPGILLAGLVGISFGIVLGPEAPVLALGPGLAVLTVGLVRRDTPPPAMMLVGAAGAFAAVSFLFGSPLIGAVLMIEVTALGGARQTMVVIPGLLAAGIGSLLAIGMGSWTGLNRSAISLGQLQVPHFGDPTIGQFGWTIALALAVAILAHVIMRGGLLTYRFSAPRPLLLLPLVGLIVAGLAIAFSQAADKSVNEVLFSGESGLSGLVAQAGTWSLSALALLIVFKGLSIWPVAWQLPGRPHFPRGIPRRRGGPHGLAPPRVLDHARGRRGHWRRCGVRTEASPVGGRACHVSHHQGRHRGRAADHRRGRSGVPRHTRDLARRTRGTRVHQQRRGATADPPPRRLGAQRQGTVRARTRRPRHDPKHHVNSEPARDLLAVAGRDEHREDAHALDLSQARRLLTRRARPGGRSRPQGATTNGSIRQREAALTPPSSIGVHVSAVRPKQANACSSGRRRVYAG